MLFFMAGSNSMFLLVYQPRTPAFHILHGRKRLHHHHPLTYTHSKSNFKSVIQSEPLDQKGHSAQSIVHSLSTSTIVQRSKVSCKAQGLNKTGLTLWPGWRLAPCSVPLVIIDAKCAYISLALVLVISVLNFT